jgi:U11/U12 small nuclear ribonucleoprotein SNRNP65
LIDSIKTHGSLSTISIACQTDESVFSEVINMDTDDDESEVDDGKEEEQVKRSRRSILRTQIRQRIVPTVEIDMTVDAEKKKKRTIELILPQTLKRHQVYETPTDITMHGFGRLEPTQSTISTVNILNQEKKQLPPLPLISLEELAKNRLSEDQLRLIDNGRLYRNYERGQPSQRLYVKNIDTKHVDERILHSIYDRYNQNSFQIDIRLMCEGKMKGQAFVTFPNEEMALNALNDTNGFVLYEKPMIVQFARTAKPKDIV